MQTDLSEEDLSLIHALQIRPRATWVQLAPILQSSPATLSRRWDQISSAGLAWVTAYMRSTNTLDMTTALVEVDCEPTSIDSLSALLAADPRVASIEHAARGRDLVLTVLTPSLDQLSSLLLDDLPKLPGMQSTRTHIATKIHFEGSKWRLDALDPVQARGLAAIPWTGDEVASSRVAFTDGHREIAEVLAKNARASASEIASVIGRPTSSVRRQLGALIRSGALTFRCEIAQLRTRWPIIATWWCRVPATELDQLVTSMRNEPRLRMCLSVAGQANVLITMWTSSLTDLMRQQEKIEAYLPTGEIHDTSVTLRTRKRMGWMLDSDGRSTGEVVPLKVS